MSKIPPLQCLFCNQCNGASAKYCNECASPLHLQPCNQCGAIGERAAVTCYKCGAEFTVPAAPEPAFVSAASELAPVPAAPKRARVPAASKRARVPAASKRVRVTAAPKLAPVPAAPELVAVPAAPVPESAPAPPIVAEQIAKPTLNEGGFAIDRAFRSKSSAQVVDMIRQGLPREVIETEGQAARVAHRDPTYLNPDPAHSAAEPQPMDETVAAEGVQNPDLAYAAVEPQPDETVAPESVQYPVLALSAVESHPRDETVESERAMKATASRRARRLAFLTLLIAATAVFGYNYFDRSAQQLAQKQSAAQPAPSTPEGGQISVDATTAAVAKQVGATSVPKDAPSQPTAGADDVEKAPSPAAGVVAKPQIDREPVSATRPLDDSESVNRPVATTKAPAGASSVRRSSVIDAGVKGRNDPPVFKECTEAVAALGFCGPIKP